MTPEKPKGLARGPISEALERAVAEYRYVFGEPYHGTELQTKALLELGFWRVLDAAIESHAQSREREAYERAAKLVEEVDLCFDGAIDKSPDEIAAEIRKLAQGAGSGM